MATTANPQPGAIPMNGGLSDPFTAPTSAAMRFAPFDTEQLSVYSSSSPSQAKRALEAHLKDTDRRLQDASRLGNTLVQQRRDLAARLKDLEEIQHDDEVPSDLRKKLAELEKEYEEIGKESARAFLPKTRVGSGMGEPGATPSALTGSGRESPTKMAAPSRRQRNQPSNRVHDIEFATEISTSLLAQVRQMQAVIAEKDEALNAATSSKAQLESEAAGMVQRIRQMDESEDRYKDENWNLEMRLQELENSFKNSTDKESRLTQSLKATESEKAAAQRDLDDLKVSHEKLNDEHALIKRQQETDLHVLRRDVATHETERSRLQKRIEELTSQNTELAKAVSYRWNQPSGATDTEFVSADEDQRAGDSTPENSEPASPVKGTPRHGMLESETLKSSLNHAHRMIQNLKNNIHREKTEKIELKRMLQDARDELEVKRNENGNGAGAAKKRRSDNSGGSSQFRKPARPLGANRGSTTEILEDEPDWEDHDGTSTPSKSRTLAAGFGGVVAGAAGVAALDHAFDDDTESTDAAFETATERDGATTDAFETGRESLAGDNDSDELTETESNVKRGDTIRRVSPMGLVGARAGDRRSFLSTASTEDEEDTVRTPVSAQQPTRYRLRNLGKGGSKRGRLDDLAAANSSPGFADSPASSNGTPQRFGGQSLGDELEGLDDGGSIEGTPSRDLSSTQPTPETERRILASPAEVDDNLEIGSPSKISSTSPTATGEGVLAQQANSAMLAHEAVLAKPVYADAGVMTEPWEPEAAWGQKVGLRERAAEVVGGALAGFGLGKLTGGKDEDKGNDEQVNAGAVEEVKENERPLTAIEPVQPVQLQHSTIMSQETAPISPQRSVKAAAAESAIPIAAAAPLAVSAAQKQKEAEILEFSTIDSQSFEPQIPPQRQSSVAAPAPLFSSRSLNRGPEVYGSTGTSMEHDKLPGTDGSVVGAGFFESQRDLDGSNEPKSLRTALGEIDPNAVARKTSEMADEGSQTVVSGSEIDGLMRNKSGVGGGGVAAGGLGGAVAGAAANEFLQSPVRPPTAINANSPRRSIDGAIAGDANVIRTPRRPASAGSMRNKAVAIPPPLPENHSQKIAAAASGKAPTTAGAGSMGPPLMPASAYKQPRPRTPADAGRTLSRDGTTPRAHRASNNSQLPPNSPAASGISRRTSMSSFASELDERFNIQRGQLLYPEGVVPATDPRMIQAITQTMIGEYLWKYTRKAGRSETSSTSRHRRFFWVHPYTRTLYWSEKDPSTAGRDMLKAKSVAIEAVRVVGDDNTYPPGLHRKSIVVVTPGREIVFTAPTSQRHETWFNALSYLLLRTEQERAKDDEAINQDDIDEFNPGSGLGGSIRRSISRFATGTPAAGGRSQSRTSLSSYHSRTTRASSPSGTRTAAVAGILSQRQSTGGLRASSTNNASSGATTPGAATSTSASRYAPAAAVPQLATQTSSRDASRFSSLTSRFRPTSAQRGSFSSSTRGRTSGMSSRSRTGGAESAMSGIYDASVAAESAEDVRGMMERDRVRDEEGRMENVRACCDGKHDVGSLSRTGRHSSFGGRFSGHTHSHAHPPVDPGSMSSRVR